MTNNTPNDRKMKINEIKESFQNPAFPSGKTEVSNAAEEQHDFFRFTRLRLLAAILIFAAFVYCDQNKVKIHEYSAKELYERIEETISTEKIIQTYFDTIKTM